VHSQVVAVFHATLDDEIAWSATSRGSPTKSSSRPALETCLREKLVVAYTDTTAFADFACAWLVEFSSGTQVVYLGLTNITRVLRRI
jgi:hypothetical protein